MNDMIFIAIVHLNISNADELMEGWKPQAESWQVLIQMNEIGMDAEYLYRPFGTLSHGERTRIMLAVLFAGENEFLLIDEPTNHLDAEAREMVKRYLASKKGFILVSHDRDLLDAVCDHMLVMNRETIEVQVGNFSSWWENKEKSDKNAIAENEKHRKEIGKLRAAADRSSRWAEKCRLSRVSMPGPTSGAGRSTVTDSPGWALRASAASSSISTKSPTRPVSTSLRNGRVSSRGTSLLGSAP